MILTKGTMKLRTSKQQIAFYLLPVIGITKTLVFVMWGFWGLIFEVSKKEQIDKTAFTKIE